MFRRFLGLDRSTPDPRLPSGDAAAPLPDSAAETATARRIVARLEALPAEEARYLAAHLTSGLCSGRPMVTG